MPGFDGLRSKVSNYRLMPSVRARGPLAVRFIAVLGVLSMALTACGGGSGSSPAPGGGTPAPVNGLVKLQITIPHATSSAARGRAPRYISSATQSVTAVVPGGPATTVALTPSNPNCVPSGNFTVCTVEVPVPVGNSTITVSTYASTDGSGTPLSTTTLPVTVVQGQVNLVTVTLNGVVASLKLSATQTQVTAGKPSSVGLFVQALDAAGKTIIGPGGYSDASGNAISITLTSSDTSGATSVSPASFPDPSNIIATLNYNGAQIPNFTITASAPGVPSQSITFSVNVSTQLVYDGFIPCTSSSAPAQTQINRYQTSANGTSMGPLVGTLTVPSIINMFTVDRANEVFVASSSAISRYAAGASDPASPAASFTAGVNPVAMAADSAGGLWLAGNDTATQAPELLHYPPNANGSVAPDRTVTGIAGLPPSLTFDAQSLAVDSRDNVYTVAEQPFSRPARVYVLPPAANGASVSPIASYPLDRAPQYPGQVSIDQHTDTVWTYPANVYAGGATVPPPAGATPIDDAGLVAYPNGSATPSRVIYNHGNGPGNGSYPKSVAVDDAGDAYVLYGLQGITRCSANWALVVYTPSQNGLVTPSTSGQAGAIALAVPPLTVPAPPSGGGGSQNPAIGASPSSFNFLASGSRYASTLSASEAGYAGSFTATSANTAIATVTAAASPNTFTVTPVNAGSTTITVRDASGGYTNVPVTVSITGLKLQGRRR